MLHANDWQTGLIPAYLKIEYRGVPGYEHIGTLFTIHNMAYQGLFWHWDMLLTGLDWKYFNWQQMEFFGNLNLLKTGLIFADRLNTVSPRYAEEIQIRAAGLRTGRGVAKPPRRALGHRQRRRLPRVESGDRSAILPANYDAETVAAGKAACKAALQAELGWPAAPDVPLIAFIGRLTEQKGIDLLAATIRDWVQSHRRAMGHPGHRRTEVSKSSLPCSPSAFRRKWPRSWSSPTGWPTGSKPAPTSSSCPAASSRADSNQLYSLKYGTVPVVRATGGLVDTITDVNDKTLAAGTATGFRFGEYSALALSETLSRACNMYRTAGRLEAAGADRHAAGLVVDRQRRASTSSCIGPR